MLRLQSRLIAKKKKKKEKYLKLASLPLNFSISAQPQGQTRSPLSSLIVLQPQVQICVEKILYSKII